VGNLLEKQSLGVTHENIYLRYIERGYTQYQYSLVCKYNTTHTHTQYTIFVILFRFFIEFRKNMQR